MKSFENTMASIPRPAKRPYALTQHGITRIDEYFWMKERENPEVIDYLRAENEYLETVLRHTGPLQEELFREMKARIKEVDSSVPEKDGEYFYYTRTVENGQYPLFCRRKGSLDAPEEILLDQNLLAEGSEFCSISAFTVSPDGTKLAYSMDLQGNEVYTLYVKDLMHGSMYPDQIGDISGSAYYRGGVEWANDNQTLFYVSVDEAYRSYQLFRHKLGTDPAGDVLIFHEKDDTYGIAVYKTRSQQYIMTYHYNTISPETRFMRADEPLSELKVLSPREHGIEYYATHHGDYFFIVTNENAPSFKLMKTPVAALGKEHWLEVIPERADVLLEHVDMFEEYMVLQERKDGLKHLRISAVDGRTNVRQVSFPEPSYDVSLEDNSEFKTNTLRLKYSSLITPSSIVDFHMDSGEWEVKKEEEIPSGYDKSLYVTERVYAIAADGAQVPLSIAYRKGIQRDGTNPALLYGYGAYGASSDANFNSNLISLFDRGFVFAMAHVRGGSEMGRSWYEEGRLLKKKNSFTDFIACAEHLIGMGITSTEKLSITGSSAGGLLVGACMVLRPDLFKAVICKVPFLDVIASMSDPTIPLTTLEYDQWGNPADKDAFDYMLSYSPYDNIRPVAYPDILLTTGFNDPRVSYWEPAKFAARLRDGKQGGGLVLIQTNFNAGHAGASGRYDFLKENMLDFAFLLDRLGQG